MIKGKSFDGITFAYNTLELLNYFPFTFSTIEG